jgi:hypothetical protein
MLRPPRVERGEKAILQEERNFDGSSSIMLLAASPRQPDCVEPESRIPAFEPVLKTRGCGDKSWG